MMPRVPKRLLLNLFITILVFSSLISDLHNLWDDSSRGEVSCRLGCSRATSSSLFVSATEAPVSDPTTAPSVSPSDSPSASPSAEPSSDPTLSPTSSPSVDPTSSPSSSPTTSTPSASPSAEPTAEPSVSPTAAPTDAPSRAPSAKPTRKPTASPTFRPTSAPTAPTGRPTGQPSGEPTGRPSFSPLEQLIPCGECQSLEDDGATCAFYSINVTIVCPVFTAMCVYDQYSTFKLSTHATVTVRGNCSLTVETAKFYMYEKSSLKAMSINISASTSVGIAGSLTSSGLGPLYGPGASEDWFVPGYGGSYGGSGGATASELAGTAGEVYSVTPDQIGLTRPDLDYSLIGTDSDPTMGSGGGMPNGGRGGGRILIYSPFIEIVGSKNGTIAADGSDATADNAVVGAVGGGSGGSIVIIADSIAGHGKIRANGGKGVFGGGGGSGGRIYIELRQNVTVNAYVFAYGGASTDIIQSSNLEYSRGGAGTIYVSTPRTTRNAANSTAFDTIVISSFETFPTGAQYVSALTLLADADLYPDLLNVTVIDGASLGVTSITLPNSSPYCTTLSSSNWCSRLNVTKARLSSKRVLGFAGFVNFDAHLQADSVEFGKDSVVLGELKVSIRSKWLQVRKGALLSFVSQMIAVASTNIEITGSIQQRSPTGLSCWNGTAIYLWSCANIDYDTATWLGANEQSGMIALSSDNSINLQSNSTLLATGILLCARELQVSPYATVSTDGFGCAPGTGIGCAFADGGAGFGGIGGLSTINNPNGICTGRIYGNYDFIDEDDSTHIDLYVGSGGGCSNCQPMEVDSRGGGIVSIEASRFMQNGVITSSGGFNTSTTISISMSGGGSGGSVFIKSSSMTGSGTIQANGSPGRNGGGGGGGGRIMYDAQDNYDISPYTGTFFTSGGSGGTAGHVGVVTPPTCPIGQSTTYDRETGILGRCAPCEVGYYKDNAGNDACIECTNKPTYSAYVSEGETTSDCTFVCNTGRIYRFDECLTSFEVFYMGMGGLAVFSVVAVSTLLLLFAPFVVVRNLRAMGFCKRKAKPLSYNNKQTLSTKLTHDWFTGVSGISTVTAMELLGDEDDLATMSQAKIAKEEVDTGLSFNSKASGIISDVLRQRVVDGSGPGQASENPDDIFIAMRQAQSLSDKDLPAHTERVYLLGTNSPNYLRSGGSWIWPASCPANIKPMICEKSYAELADATTLALRWQMLSFENVCLVLTALFFPAHASQFIRIRRSSRARFLLIFMAKYNHKCFKNKKQRREKQSIRVSISPDMTLAYIDFLFKDDPECIYKPLIMPGQPRLPLHIRLAGLGTYFSPWHVDTNDKLIQAVPQYSLLEVFIYAAWLDFIADLNKNLRNITRTELRRGLPMLTQFLGDVWTMKRLGGLIVEFCVFVNTEYRGKISRRHNQNNLSVDEDADNRSIDRETGVSHGSALQKSLLKEEAPSSLHRETSFYEEAEEEDVKIWRVLRTPRTFRALCDGLGNGELMPGIVIYHPSVVDDNGSWISTEFRSPYVSGGDNIRPESPSHSKVLAELEYEPPNIIEDSSNDQESQAPPATPNPLLYGNKAADLERFYKIVSVADKRESAKRSDTSSNMGDIPMVATSSNRDNSGASASSTVTFKTIHDDAKSEGSVDDVTPKRTTAPVPVSPSRSANESEATDDEYMSFPMAHSFDRSKKWTFGMGDFTGGSHKLDTSNVAGAHGEYVPPPMGYTKRRNRADTGTSIESSELNPPSAPASSPTTVDAKTGVKEIGPSDVSLLVGPDLTIQSRRTDVLERSATIGPINDEEVDFEVTAHSMWRWDKYTRRMVNVHEVASKELPMERQSSQSSLQSALKKERMVSNDFQGKEERASSSELCLTILKDYLLNFLLATWSVLNRFLLGRNASPRGPAALRHVIATTLQVCCLFDFVALSFLAVTYWCIWDDESLCNSQIGFYIIIGVWPGALLVAPVSGFASLTLGSMGTLPRVYSVWSRLAIISYLNLVWIFLTRRNNAPGYTLLVLVGMGISRFLQCSFVDLYIAHLESLRRTRGWDGLPTSLVIARDNDDTVV